MILPSQADRGIVVFKLWPNLSYGRRMALSFALIALGLALQLPTGSFLIGALPLLAGNLLLLVSGYDSRVDFKAYDPSAHWERVETGLLTEVLRIHRAIRRWDASALDVTNGLGGFLFVLLTAGLVALAVTGAGYVRLFALDAALLLLPHWITGVRRVLTRPKLLLRAQTIQEVLEANAEELEPHHLQLLALLGDDELRLPRNLKLKVDIADHDDDFLGLYGQVVLNDVQGTSHPYFYVVLVARDGYGLGAVYDTYEPPHDVTMELKHQDEVEVLVLRRTTTKTSGYETKPAKAAAIFRAGLELAERAAVRPQAAA